MWLERLNIPILRAGKPGSRSLYPPCDYIRIRLVFRVAGQHNLDSFALHNLGHGWAAHCVVPSGLQVYSYGGNPRGYVYHDLIGLNSNVNPGKVLTMLTSAVFMYGRPRTTSPPASHLHSTDLRHSRIWKDPAH